MLSNFARRRYLTRLSLWHILAWVIGRLVIGFILALLVGIIAVFILATIVKVPVR